LPDSVCGKPERVSNRSEKKGDRMIKRKDWQAYKKKHEIPDGVSKKVSLGDVLEKYDKSKKTDADFDKLEAAIKTYVAAAKAAKLPKAADYLTMSLNSEIAARDEAAANAPKVKPKATGPTAKFYTRLVQQLGKHHANVSSLATTLKDNPGWFQKGATDKDVALKDKTLAALEKELEAMFKFCREEGGDTVDISLAYYNRLRNVSDKAYKDLTADLKECLETVMETAEHIREKL